MPTISKDRLVTIKTETSKGLRNKVILTDKTTDT